MTHKLAVMKNFEIYAKAKADIWDMSFEASREKVSTWVALINKR